MSRSYFFASLHETFEARASEWALTGMVISLSLVFILNTDLIESPNFIRLRSISDNSIWWAAICFVVGISRLTVLLINGSYWRTPHLRALTAFLSLWIWFLFIVGFVRNGSLMAAIMPWIFILDAYNAKRSAREAGKSEFIQRYGKKEHETRRTGYAHEH